MQVREIIRGREIFESLGYLDSDGQKQNKSVLAKLIEKAGPKSQIPLVMAMDAILAGIDTTANTLAFLLYDLAVNPDHQEKLYNEIVEVVGERGRVTEAKLKKLRYLKACLQESQRMRPTCAGFTRETQQEMVLGGYQIPSGTVEQWAAS